MTKTGSIGRTFRVLTSSLLFVGAQAIVSTASAQAPGFHEDYSDQSEKDKITQIGVLIKTHDYEGIESRYKSINDSSVRNSHGETEAVSFVYSLQEYLASMLRDRTSEGEAFINTWLALNSQKSQSEQSDLARIVQTRAYVTYAAKYGSRPYAGMHSPALLRMSGTIINGNADWAEQHPAAGELKIMHTLVSTMDEEKVADAVRSVLALHPHDESVVYASLLYAEGDTVDATARIVGETAGDAGYARVHRWASYIGPEFYGARRIEELSNFWDWARLRRGAETILQAYPTQQNVTEFSRLAIAAGDTEFLTWAASLLPSNDDNEPEPETPGPLSPV